MNMLSDTVKARLIAIPNNGSQAIPYEKVAYRGWVWLATFALGTATWVGLGYGVWILFT
jgi:hypothetical protein